MAEDHDSFMVDIWASARVNSASLEHGVSRYLNDVLWGEIGQNECLKRSKLGGEKKNNTQQPKDRNKI